MPLNISASLSNASCVHVSTFFFFEQVGVLMTSRQRTVGISGAPRHRWSQIELACGGRVGACQWRCMPVNWRCVSSKADAASAAVDAAASAVAAASSARAVASAVAAAAVASSGVDGPRFGAF